MDIADLEACRRTCNGIDTVVHLAADPGPIADFYGSLLDATIKGAFNILRAAADAGCRRSNRKVFSRSTIGCGNAIALSIRFQDCGIRREDACDLVIDQPSPGADGIRGMRDQP